MLSFKGFLREQILRELTISPEYQQKGVFNPYYTLTNDVVTAVSQELKIKKIQYDEILFKNVLSPKGTNLGGKGKFYFQIVVKQGNKEKDIKHYISTQKNQVTGHYGMKTRKDSTASSNVNEIMSVYFLKHPKFKDAQSFIAELGGLQGGTGIFTGEDKEVSYDDLRGLIDRDATPERDVLIGYNNSKAIKKDLPKTYKRLYWTPRGKPGGIYKNNPSDVIIDLGKNNYIGYSNKITVGKDVTPKFNTAISSFYTKLDDRKQYSNIVKLIDESWNETAKKVKGANAKKALKSFRIENEKASESASKSKFAQLAKEFAKDKLNFYADDFYYPFRNTFIEKLGTYLKTPKNLLYFLNTIGFYMYPGDTGSTPCPYKLLIGTEGGSTIKEVSTNEEYKELLLNRDVKQLGNYKMNYDGKSQQFTMNFRYKLYNYSISIPITARTRTSGGWSGKALYVTTPGIKLN